MKNRSLLWGILLISAPLAAQRPETVFGNGLGMSGIWGAATHQYVFFEGFQGYQRGGNIGVEFGRTIFIGYAWSKLKEDIGFVGLPATFRLKQNNLLVTLIPQSYQVIHPTISFQTGGARLEFADGATDRLFVFQPSAGLEINIFRWFHLGVEGGYRFISDVDMAGLTNENLSTPFGQINLRFGAWWGGSCR